MCSLIQFLLLCCVEHCDLRSFPTRRSSDLPATSFTYSRVSGLNAQGRGLVTAASSVARYRRGRGDQPAALRSEEHTSELQSRRDLVCRLLLEKKKTQQLSLHIHKSHIT